ncbi:hypothetical protein AC062_1604 [Pasteurellaceae bacterium NI1060]|nr:hypothetical protein AC062_1604 [Pasteurellaceae bacterium NI1060]
MILCLVNSLFYFEQYKKKYKIEKFGEKKGRDKWVRLPQD